MGWTPVAVRGFRADSSWIFAIFFWSSLQNVPRTQQKLFGQNIASHNLKRKTHKIE